MYPYENFTVPGLNSINFQGPYNKMEIPRVSGRDGANLRTVLDSPLLNHTGLLRSKNRKLLTQKRLKNHQSML